MSPQYSCRERILVMVENGENYLQYKPIHAELKKLKNGWTNKRDTSS